MAQTKTNANEKTRKYAWGSLTLSYDNTRQLYYSIDGGDRHAVPFQFSGSWTEAFRTVNDYLERQNY